MIFSILMAIGIAFAALTLYASCCVAAEADRQTEKYFAEKRSENLKKF